MEKGQACDDCGQLFDTVHDVQRHVKNGWCPDIRKQLKRKRRYDSADSDEIVSKRRKLEDDFDDNDGYVNLLERAKAKWGKKV